jgi:2-hydroxy-6-oxonona-2,4-dienedioate hydrolase
MNRLLPVAFLLLFCGVTAAQQPASPAPAPSAAPAADGFVTLYGNRIHYIDTGGAGPVVILIHGMSSDLTDWVFNKPILERDFRVVALDQLGYGKSDKPMVNYRVATWVDYLDAFMKELKIERASLVGASMGGWIAAAFAIEHPQRVDKLVLIDSAGYSNLYNLDARTLSRRMNPSTRAEVLDILKMTFHGALFHGDAVVDRVYTRRMSSGDGYTNQRVIDSFLRGDDVLDGRYGKITAPTLLVWGREDKLVPLEIARRMQKEIPGSRLEVIDGAGHLPQVEQAMKFNQVLLQFLSGGAN